MEYVLITPGNSLYFPAIDFIKTSVGKAGLTSSHLPVVIDCRFILGADFTAARGISALIDEFVQRKQPLYFINTRDEVLAIFKGAVMEDFTHFRNMEELERELKELKERHNPRENEKLLENFENITFNVSNSVELKEVTCEEKNQKSFRRRSLNEK